MFDGNTQVCLLKALPSDILVQQVIDKIGTSCLQSALRSSAALENSLNSIKRCAEVRMS